MLVLSCRAVVEARSVPTEESELTIELTLV